MDLVVVMVSEAVPSVEEDEAVEVVETTADVTATDVTTIDVTTTVADETVTVTTDVGTTETVTGGATAAGATMTTTDTATIGTNGKRIPGQLPSITSCRWQRVAAASQLRLQHLPLTTSHHRLKARGHRQPRPSPLKFLTVVSQLPNSRATQRTGSRNPSFIKNQLIMNRNRFIKSRNQCMGNNRNPLTKNRRRLLMMMCRREWIRQFSSMLSLFKKAMKHQQPWVNQRRLKQQTTKP